MDFEKIKACSGELITFPPVIVNYQSESEDFNPIFSSRMIYSFFLPMTCPDQEWIFEHTYQGPLPLHCKTVIKRWHVLITKLSEKFFLTNPNLTQVLTPCSFLHAPWSQASIAFENTATSPRSIPRAWHFPWLPSALTHHNLHHLSVYSYPSSQTSVLCWFLQNDLPWVSGLQALPGASVSGLLPPHTYFSHSTGSLLKTALGLFISVLPPYQEPGSQW